MAGDKEQRSAEQADTEAGMTDPQPPTATPLPEHTGAVRRCPDCGRQWSLEEAPDRCPDHGNGTMLLTVSPEDGLVGRVIDNRYEIKQLLGQGGMGVVYRAFQRAVCRDVAVKFLRRAYTDDFVAVKRFYKEARAASGLTHPNTITVFDFGQTRDGLLYFTMELLEGESLLNVLEREKRLNPVRAIRIAMQICDSLAEAHEKGVIHRDLKPENVQLEQRHGHPDFVKVLDFGIARTIRDEKEKRLTRSGMVCGTAAYMSPEGAQALATDQRSDMYSVGIMLFEMLTGRLPFEGISTMEVMMAHVGSKAPRLQEHITVPPALDDLVHQLMAKEPSRRPSTVLALRKDLAKILSDIESVGESRNPMDRTSETHDHEMPSEDEIERAESAVSRQSAVDRRGSGAMWIAAGAALAGAVGLLLVLSGVFDRAPAEPPKEPPQPVVVAESTAPTEAPSEPSGGDPVEAPTASPPPEVVHLPRRDATLTESSAVRSAPDAPKATSIRTTDLVPTEVWEGKKRIGSTPFDCLLIDGRTRKLVLKRRGFYPAELSITPETSDVLMVAMTKRKAARKQPRNDKWSAKTGI